MFDKRAGVFYRGIKLQGEAEKLYLTNKEA